MNDDRRLSQVFAEELNALAASAPPTEFPALWREVAARREARLQRGLALAATLATLLLFSAGIVSLMLGDGIFSALPLVGVAVWLAANGTSPPKVTESILARG